ncbi:DUF3592 domain-containing protein [Streptacidiphilus sp. N1-10]|uniref:DUF3592 domain-containing protein n=1 Tax=Streptacidiphilus jeojiensis TaxID=3229225 RepID=A0ABV6XNT6_9ACTN
MALGAFALLCGVAGLLVLVIGARAVRRRVRTRRTLSDGLPADGQVLHIYTVPGDQGRDGVQHAVVAFRTVDGRRMLTNDESGLSRAVGDQVPVRYLPERPQDAVLADLPPNLPGAVLLGLCGTGFAVACLSAAVLAIARMR